MHLGIDYGTSNTVAVLRRPDGRTRPLMFDGTPLLSSAVFAADAQRLLVGRDAERAARTDPSRYEGNPKRRIDDFDVLLGAHAHGVSDLIAATLGRIEAEARRVAGAALTSVTITHPVAWGPARRKVLLGAAERVGLPTPVLVPEPVAAAAYFTGVLGNVVPVGNCVVVYDLGAGTFDVSVVQRTGTGFETLAYRGLDDVGGLDLDALIVQHVGQRLAVTAPDAWRRLSAPADAQDQRHRLQLWHDARDTREALTREASASLFVAAAEQDVLVTRAEFEHLAAPVLQQTVETTIATVREARIRAEQITGWFLVGGATRTPLVATLLLRATGQPATVLEEPQMVVADGAVQVTAGPIGATVISSTDLPRAVPVAPMVPAAAPVSPVPPVEPVVGNAPPVGQVSPAEPVSPGGAGLVSGPPSGTEASGGFDVAGGYSTPGTGSFGSPAAQGFGSPVTPVSPAAQHFEPQARPSPQTQPHPPAQRPQGPVRQPGQQQVPQRTQPAWPVWPGDGAPAASPRAGAPLRMGGGEIAGLIFGLIAAVIGFLGLPVLGALLVLLLLYRAYRQLGPGRGWLDLTAAVLFLFASCLAALGGLGVVAMALTLVGGVAGVIWIRRFVTDRADPTRVRRAEH